MEAGTNSSRRNHLEELKLHVETAEARIARHEARIREMADSSDIEMKNVLRALIASLQVARECVNQEEQLEALRPWYVKDNRARPNRPR